MSRFDSRVVDGALATVGVAALTLAALVAYAPGVVPVAPLASVLTPGATSAIIGLAVVGLVAAVAHGVLFGADDGGPEVELPTPPAATAADRDEVETAGDWIDDRLATLRGDADDAERSGYASFVETRVAQRIRPLAVEVVADARGCSERAAQRTIEDGTWTDRPRARAFLGEDVPSLPLSVRFRDWASGERVDRQVRATVEELAALSTVDLETTLAPDRADADRDEAEAWTAPEFEDVDVDPEGFYRPDVFDDVDGLALDPSDGDPSGDRPATERAGGERR